MLHAPFFIKMIYKIFELLALSATFLSFTAVTYTPPWTSSGMEFFAFVSVIFLWLSIPWHQQKFFLSRTSKFTLLLIISSLFIFLISESIFIENLSLLILYTTGIISFCNSLAHKNIDFQLQYIYCIVFSGLFSSFVIFTQYFDISHNILSVWIADYSSTHGRPYANFGQPNLASTLILSSLCCCIYLHQYKKISTASLYLISIFLGCALAPPASKTAMLTLSVLLITSALFKDLKSFASIALASASYAIFKIAQPESRDLLAAGISTGRFELWQTIFLAIEKSPWLGYGVLNTRAAHFEVRELGNNPLGQTIGNSHNIILDFLVWFGVFIGGALSIIFIGMIFYIFLKSKKNHRAIFLAIPILIHSQLEYPLSYANFLFLFSFSLYIIDDNIKTNQPRNKLISWLIFLIFTGTLAIVTIDYKSIETNYTNLRFFNKGFINAENPEKITTNLLDITTKQFNLFTISQIEDEASLREVQSLTKLSPTLHNYHLIIFYLKKQGDRDDELKYWMEKLKNNFFVESNNEIQKSTR